LIIVRIHTLERTIIVAASLEACWSFFSDARNLSRLTPPELGLEITSELPPVIYPGLMIQYR